MTKVLTTVIGKQEYQTGMTLEQAHVQNNIDGIMNISPLSIMKGFNYIDVNGDGNLSQSEIDMANKEIILEKKSLLNYYKSELHDLNSRSSSNVPWLMLQIKAAYAVVNNTSDKVKELEAEIEKLEAEIAQYSEYEFCA